MPDAVLALERLMSGGGDPIELVLTLDPSTLQALGIADRPWLVVNGPLLPEQLGPLQASAGVIFFPCELESFGFPLAEARVNRQPVVAPDTALSREVAGDALVPYHPGDVNSLAAAFDEALGLTLPPLRENPFDPGRYFTCLFEFQS
ncbi:MAG: hypothetical protein ACRDYB_07760 [Acidimicrobiales bacterium]